MTDDPRDWYVSDMTDRQHGYKAFGPMTEREAQQMLLDASPERRVNLWAHYGGPATDESSSS